MKTDDAIKLFGSVRLLAESLRLSVQAIYKWGETVPPLRAYQIRELIAAKPAEVGAGDTAPIEQQAA